MLAIHASPHGFHPHWIAHCEEEGMPYKRVDCHASDIMEQLRGCKALMWHYGQSSPRDILIARQILNALEHAGLTVFPDFHTAWHFDDKVAQKYLFEALDLPLVPAHVFVDRDEALSWVDRTGFPKVFKLRRGAGSHGVKLVGDRAEARRLVRRAFGRGFPLYDRWGSLKERIYKYHLGKYPATELIKGLARLVHPPRFSRVLGPERGYVYFQDYLPGNDYDTRVIVIGDRAFGIRRLVRPGDFRASGSGRISYAREDIDERCVALGFDTASRLGGSCVALDFVYDQQGQPWILEVSYGFIKEVYDHCPGYWDTALNWHEDKFNPQAWMVDLVMERID
jgi:glutathione synthase/RimK-type ligase-like ATP-grasp enzyme